MAAILSERALAFLRPDLEAFERAGVAAVAASPSACTKERSGADTMIMSIP